MSNKVYGDTYKNPHIKDEYLSEFNQSTQKTIINIFKKTYELENILRKDLYNFTLDEIDLFFLNSKKRSLSTTRMQLNVISNYIDWAKNNGFVDSNPLKYINIRQYATKYFDDEENSNKIYTDDEIFSIEESCLNFQDSIILRLLFEGVCGQKMRELTNLSSEDVDEKLNLLRLNDGRFKRDLKVSNRCIYLINMANEQKTYHRSNKKGNLEFFDTGKLIKLTKIRTDVNDENITDEHVIYRRLRSLMTTKGNLKVNPKDIIKSGMLYAYRELLLNKVETEEAKRIVCLKFGLIKKESTEKLIRSALYRASEDILNDQALSKIY